MEMDYGLLKCLQSMLWNPKLSSKISPPEYASFCPAVQG
jgi:hypothetical protein